MIEILEKKDCPFCGKQPKGYPHGWYVECPECKVRINGISYENAVKRWNTRHESTCKPNLTERKIDANGETYRFWQAVCDCGWIVGEDGVNNLSKFEHLDNYCGGCGARVIEE